MKSMARVYFLGRAGFFALALLAAFGIGAARAQNEPMLVPDAVDYQKLLPINAFLMVFSNTFTNHTSLLCCY